MFDLSERVTDLATDTDALADAVATRIDLEPGWSERPPAADAIAAIEADLDAIPAIAIDLGWTEVEPDYWEPPGDYPAPDEPLYHFQEMLGQFGPYENEIMPGLHEASGEEVLTYLSEGGPNGSPCGGALSVVMFYEAMLQLAG